jgi:hypothetical protein
LQVAFDDNSYGQTKAYFIATLAPSHPLLSIYKTLGFQWIFPQQGVLIMKKYLLLILLLCACSGSSLFASQGRDPFIYNSGFFACNCPACVHLDEVFDPLMEKIRGALPEPDQLADTFHYMGFASGGMWRDYKILQQLICSGHIKKELYISLIDIAYGSDAPPSELIPAERLEAMKQHLQHSLREFGVEKVIVHTYTQAPAREELAHKVDLAVAIGVDMRPLPQADVSALEQCLDDTTPYLFHVPHKNRGLPFMGRGPTITKIPQLLGGWDADLIARMQQFEAQKANKQRTP